jgi:L-fucose isomerase-like protein|tara:strand:- start:244 stop:405 length:162 start_codon:yes stop_codon:yes gene_type:complete
MQRINKEQKNENIIKEWIKNIKIQRIMAKEWPESDWNITTWQMIKEATKMIWR